VSTWQPILHGEEAEKALHLIVTISQEIVYPWDSPWRWGSELREPDSLAFGNAGVALFFSYAAKVLQDRNCVHTAELFIRDAIQATLQDRMQPGFEVGAAGIYWALEHIRNAVGLGAQVQNSAAEWDQRLAQFCRTPGVPGAFADGLAGLVVYAAERMPDPSAEFLLRAALDQLEGISVRTDDGIAWHVCGCSEAALREFFPGLSFAQRRYSASLGYGIAGIVGALISAYESGIREPQVKRMIEGAVSWLLGRKRGPDYYQLFPLIVGIEMPAVSNGWYLGDPGIVIAILNAAKVLDREDWQAAIIGAACKMAKSASKFNGHNLLYGSIGRAHICNRLFQMTGNEQFVDAAREWYSLALGFQKPKEEKGGILEDGRYFQGLFWGTAGLGLGLLAAISSVEPSWDRAFLASFRSVSQPSTTLSSSSFVDVCSVATP